EFEEPSKLLAYIRPMRDRFGNRRKIRKKSSRRQAALKRKKNEIGAAAHAKLVKQIRNVKLHRALGDVQLAGDFLVGKIFEQRIEHFLLAAAEFSDGIGLQAAALARKNRIDESRQKLTRNSAAPGGQQRESAT